MATYDPEAVRSRPAAPKESPVDALLDGESETNSNAFEAVEELSENTDTNRDSVGDQGKGSDQNSEDFQPFEVPPVESIDENADRANRLGVLIATLLLFAFAIFWKKRKRSDPQSPSANLAGASDLSFPSEALFFINLVPAGH